MADASLDSLSLDRCLAGAGWSGPASAAPRRDLAGQSLVEYALIILLIALTVFVAVSMLGGQLQGLYSQIAASFQR
jgi:Flp pilus assembly pilin Flp